MTNFSKITSAKEMIEYLNTLEPKYAGKSGGRVFVPKNNTDKTTRLSLNNIIKKIITLKDATEEEKDALHKKINILDKIEIKTPIAHKKLKEIGTKIRRTFGNIFFDRDKALEKWKQNPTLPTNEVELRELKKKTGSTTKTKNQENSSLHSTNELKIKKFEKAVSEALERDLGRLDEPFQKDILKQIKSSMTCTNKDNIPFIIDRQKLNTFFSKDKEPRLDIKEREKVFLTIMRKIFWENFSGQTELDRPARFSLKVIAMALVIEAAFLHGTTDSPNIADDYHKQWKDILGEELWDCTQQYYTGSYQQRHE